MDWSVVITPVFLIGLAAAAVRTAVPLLLAAVGEVFAERSGVLNIGIEGMMLFGAFAGFGGAFFAQNAWAGVLTSMAAGMLMAIAFAYVTVTLGADQITAGIALNILGLGLSAFLFRVAFGIEGLPPTAPSFGSAHIPGLSTLPILGPVLFQHNPLVYLTVVLTVAAHIVLFHTTFGLRVRAAGEVPAAVDAAGVNIQKVRYAAVLIGGATAGLAGAFLSLGYLNVFSEDMVAGRGFIALAVVIFGNWTPGGAVGASVLFGLAEAVQLRLQALGFHLPYQLLLMIPYVLTVLVMVGVVRRSTPPAALALPYMRLRRRASTSY